MTLQHFVKHKEIVVKGMSLFVVDILMTLYIVAYEMDLPLSVMSSRGLFYSLTYFLRIMSSISLEKRRSEIEGQNRNRIFMSF